MKKEIIVGVVAAVLASFITYMATNVERKLSDIQLEKIAADVVLDKDFNNLLLNKLEEDDRFKPKDGEDGLNGVRSVLNKNTDWCADVGSSLRMCWGYIDLSTANSHTRNFNFRYATPFSVPPTVTHGINANSSGWAFSVYNSTISESEYKGSIVEHTGRNNQTPVKMSYIAIGPK